MSQTKLKAARYGQDVEVRFSGPFRGINLATDSSEIGPRDAAACQNVSLKRGTLLKRPGWEAKIAAAQHSGDPILGVYDFLRSTGTGIDVLQLFKAGAKLYRSSNWSVTELASGLSETALACFLTANNCVYYADGANFKAYRDGDANPWAEAQITRPGSVPTFGSLTSGNLTGTYDYKVTFYSSTWGQESSASDASATQAPSSQQIALTGIATSADGRVDKRRIYRRKVSAGESVWSFVYEIPNNTATTWTDNTLDESIDYLTISPLSYSSTLPYFRFLAYQADVTFAAGSADYPTRLYVTRAGKPWCMDQWLDIGSGHDTDPITGLAGFQGYLVIFKLNSIWLLSGNSPDTFYLRKTIPGIGCRSHHSIVEIPDALCFLSTDGFYAFNGASVSRISGSIPDPIAPLVTGRNYARDEWCVGVYDPDHQAVMWSYSTGATNDSIIVYWIENSKRVNFPSWTPWVLSEDVNCWTCITDYATKRKYVLFGTSGGNLGAWGGDGDASATEPVEYYWRTGDLDGGMGELQKRYGEFTADTKVENASSSLLVRYYRNEETSPTLLVTHDLVDPVIRRRLGRSARSLALEFYANTSTPAEVLSWTLEMGKGGLA